MNTKLIFFFALALVVIAAPKVEGAQKTVTADENQSAELSCSTGKISIVEAIYEDLTKDSTSGCFFPIADVVSKSCTDKQTCSFPVNNAPFDYVDPCPGISKQLSVTYDCV